MAGENISGRIEVLVGALGDAGGSGSAEGGQSTPKSGSSSVDPNQKKRDNEQKGQGKVMKTLGGIGGKMAGMMGVVGIAIKAIMGSAVFSTAFGVFMDILSAMVSMLLLPLVPVLIPILQILAEFIPLIGELATAILGPIMTSLALLLEILMPFIKFLLGAVTVMLEGFNKVYEQAMKPIKDAVEYAAGFYDKVLGKNLIEIKEFWLEKFPQWIKALPGNIAKAIKDFFSGFFSTSGGGGIVGGVKKMLGFQTGTDYVPKDMMAYLHKGEKVLSPTESVGGGGSVSIAFNSPIIGSISMSGNASLDEVSRVITDRVMDAITSASRSKSWMG